jgi:4'-phosphopantetheinyl transferase EntD
MTRSREAWALLLGPNVELAIRRPGHVPLERLCEVELEAIANAVPKRRLEMAAGRDAAREALARLGVLPAAIPSAAGGAPRWPEGFVGSITHTNTLCAAVVARDTDVVAIGLDAEPAGPLERELWAEILTEDELAVLTLLDAETAAARARWTFCAKEAAYKCQYPLSGLLLDFGDLEIRWTDESGERIEFTAHYRRDAPPFRRGDRIPGVLAHIDDHVVAVAKLLPTHLVGHEHG